MSNGLVPASQSESLAVIVQQPTAEGALPQPTRAAPVRDLALELLDRMNGRHGQSDSEVSGLSTGFSDLDYLTTGMYPGDLIIISGRPSMGKSALSMNIAQHVAKDGQSQVVVFSMEMDRHQLVERMMSALAKVDLQGVRSGKLWDSDWLRISAAIEILDNLNLTIDDTPALTIRELALRARSYAEGTARVGLVVVDYIQLMACDRRDSAESRANQISEISRGLKALARELCCPVIALSQLTRAVEARNDKRPMMSDLRDSGAIEEDADVILFLHRNDYYARGHKRSGVADLTVSKQRNGPTGALQLAFFDSQTRFESIAVLDGK